MSSGPSSKLKIEKEGNQEALGRHKSHIQKHARQAQGTFTSHMLVSMLFPTGKLPAKTRYQTQEVGEAPAKTLNFKILKRV